MELLCFVFHIRISAPAVANVKMEYIAISLMRKRAISEVFTGVNKVAVAWNLFALVKSNNIVAPFVISVARTSLAVSMYVCHEKERFVWLEESGSNMNR